MGGSAISGQSSCSESGIVEWVRLPISRLAGGKESPRGGVFRMLRRAR